MRGMVLSGTGEIDTAPLILREDLPVPEPGPDDARIKVTVCGVCRTDLHIIEGELPPAKRPLVPGHMAVGRVDRVGRNVRSFKAGDRVGVAWLQHTCGHCEFCQTARQNLCVTPTFTGYHVDGGYAEYVVVPEAFAYPLPSVLTDEEAAPLLCAGIIGYRALRLSGIQPGQRLGLYGFGASAHIAIQVARSWGCSIFVCSWRQAHQALAKALGAVWVGGAIDAPPEKLHGAIVFAPAGEIVVSALRAVMAGGTVACAGIHMTPIPSIDYDTELFGERVLRSVTANTKQDGLDLLREAAAIPIRPRTQRFALDQANTALQELKRGTIQGAAVLAIGT